MMMLQPMALDALELRELPNVANLLGSFDTGYAVHLQLISDPGHGMAEDPLGSWEADGEFLRHLDEQQREVDRHLEQLEGFAPERRLRLVVQSSLGRALLVPCRKPSEGHLAMLSLENLDVVVHQRDVDGGSLWKYFVALDTYQASARIGSFSFLDTYAMYRERSSSFYISDDGRFDYLAVGSDMGRVLRESARRKNDIHLARLPGGAYQEVICRYDASIPVYVGRAETLRGNSTYNVRVGACSVWLSASSRDGKHGAHDYAETLAYWSWQLLKAFPARWSGTFEVRCELLSEAEPQDSELVASSFVGSRQSSLTVAHGFEDHAMGPDNRAERLLVREIAALLERGGRAASAPSVGLEEIVDRAAPLGIKKKLLIIGTNVNPLLWEGGVRRRVKLCEHEVEAELNGLGDRIAAEVGLPVPLDPVPDAHFTAVLAAAKSQALANLSRHLRQWSKPSLLRRLIEVNESATRETAFEAFSTPPSLACFEDSSGRRAEILKHSQELSRASLAIRFAIEVAIAEPLGDGTTIAQLDVDSLLAAAHHFVNWSMLGEEHRCRVHRHSLSLLPSGRLGVQRGERGLDAFAAEKAEESSSRVAARFDSFWRAPEPPQESDRKREFEAAFAEEFGISPQTLRLVADELYMIAHDAGVSCHVASTEEVVAALEGRVSADDARACLSLLVLDERKSWNTPPQGFDMADILPEKYKRRLSFISRPVLRLEDGTLMWGPRHVSRSVEYTLMLLVSGQYRVANLQSAAMKSWRAARVDERGRQFEEAVAEGLAQSTSLRLFLGKKIGPRRYFVNDEEVGDIDIAACDEANKVLYAIECKAIEAGRSPAEISQEADRLVREDPRKPKSSSTMTLHGRRVQWVAEHWSAVAEGFQLRGDGWRIVPVIVTSSLLPSAYLVELRMPVRSWDEIAQSPELRLGELRAGPWVISLGGAAASLKEPQF